MERSWATPRAASAVKLCMVKYYMLHVKHRSSTHRPYFCHSDRSEAEKAILLYAEPTAIALE